MDALIVTAHMRNAIAVRDPWSPSLDGILGYWRMREYLGVDAFMLQTARPDLREPLQPLPLETVEHGEHWWHACSAPIYEGRAEALQFYHRRFDAQHAERYMRPRKGKVPVKAGPYKNFRLHERLVLAPQVQWHAIGDAGEIRRLLSRCSHIGAKASHGRGRVERWTVEAVGVPEMARYYRPLPKGYAEKRGIEGLEMLWGIRPPAREHTTACIMPEVR